MLLQVFLHVDRLVEVRIDDDGVLLLIYTQFFYAEIDQLELQFIQINTVLHRHGEASLAVEKELQRTLCTQCAAELGEVRTDVRYRTHVVVRSGLYEDSHAVRTVSFVIDLLVSLRRFIRCFFDRAVDIVLRHVLALTLLDQRTQTRVGIRIRTTLTSSNSDFLTQFGKCTGHMSPTFQFSCFAIFKRSSHNNTNF